MRNAGVGRAPVMTSSAMRRSTDSPPLPPPVPSDKTESRSAIARRHCSTYAASVSGAGSSVGASSHEKRAPWSRHSSAKSVKSAPRTRGPWSKPTACSSCTRGERSHQRTRRASAEVRRGAHTSFGTSRKDCCTPAHASVDSYCARRAQVSVAAHDVTPRGRVPATGRRRAPPPRAACRSGSPASCRSSCPRTSAPAAPWLSGGRADASTAQAPRLRDAAVLRHVPLAAAARGGQAERLVHNVRQDGIHLRVAGG